MKPISNAIETQCAAVIFVATCMSAVTWAQSPAQQQQMEKQQKMQALAQSTKENAQLLKQYTWKMRTEIQQKGEVKGVKLDQVRFDIDGKPQLTPLSAPSERKQAAGIRPGAKRRRQKMINNKVEDQQEYFQRLISLSNRYLMPSQSVMQKLFQSGQFWQGIDPTNPVVRVQASDLLKPGDELILTIDPQTKKPRRTEAKTNLDGDPVSVVADHRVLPDGPSYIARTVIQAPERQTQIKIENFDYAR